MTNKYINSKLIKNGISLHSNSRTQLASIRNLLEKLASTVGTTVIPGAVNIQCDKCYKKVAMDPTTVTMTDTKMICPIPPGWTELDDGDHICDECLDKLQQSLQKQKTDEIS